MIAKATEQTRVPVLLSKEDLEALDEWQFANKIRTRSDAIRELIRQGTKTPRNQQ